MALILVIQNKSDLASLSDYDYQVLVGDGTVGRSLPLAQGRIEKHDRSQNWQALVKKVLDQETP